MSTPETPPIPATASQTVGPYFHLGLAPRENAASGELVTIQGRVLDGDGAPVNDALIEIWQADARGEYAQPQAGRNKSSVPGCPGFTRVATDETGVFRFSTIKPGRVPGPGDALQAPHLAVAVFMRGLLKQLLTRIYFPDDAANANDPVLMLAPAGRRATLIARKAGSDADPFEWNVVLQGRDETVFFDA